MVDPSALHLTIAAFFAPLQNQAFISTVEICEYDQVMIGFSDRAPQDLGEKMAHELSGIPATLVHSGLTLDLSSLNSRAQIRAVGSQVEETSDCDGVNRCQSCRANANQSREVRPTGPRISRQCPSTSRCVSERT